MSGQDLVAGGPGDGGELLEAAAVRLPSLKIAILHEQLRHARLAHDAIPDRNEPIRLLVRQRPQQHRVRHAEHRSVGANRQRQRDDGGHRETGRAAQRPRRVGQIAPEIVDPDNRPRVAVELLRLLQAAEREPRRAMGVVRSQATAAVFVFEQSQVRRYLAREIRLRSTGTHRVGDSQKKAAHRSVTHIEALRPDQPAAPATPAHRTRPARRP